MLASCVEEMDDDLRLNTFPIQPSISFKQIRIKHYTSWDLNAGFLAVLEADLGWLLALVEYLFCRLHRSWRVVVCSCNRQEVNEEYLGWTWTDFIRSPTTFNPEHFSGRHDWFPFLSCCCVRISSSCGFLACAVLFLLVFGDVCVLSWVKVRLMLRHKVANKSRPIRHSCPHFGLAY